jgi:hypothetical protein
MRFGHYGIPLSIKVGLGHGSQERKGGRHKERRRKHKQKSKEVVEKLGFGETSVETYMIYIL